MALKKLRDAATAEKNAAGIQFAEHLAARAGRGGVYLSNSIADRKLRKAQGCTERTIVSGDRNAQ
jgi:hypothetical protein